MYFADGLQGEWISLLFIVEREVCGLLLGTKLEGDVGVVEEGAASGE
jgi:hypothetical protein